MDIAVTRYVIRYRHHSDIGIISQILVVRRLEIWRDEFRDVLSNYPVRVVCLLSYLLRGMCTKDCKDLWYGGWPSTIIICDPSGKISQHGDLWPATASSGHRGKLLNSGDLFQRWFPRMPIQNFVIGTCFRYNYSERGPFVNTVMVPTIV